MPDVVSVSGEPRYDRPAIEARFHRPGPHVIEDDDIARLRFRRFIGLAADIADLPLPSASLPDVQTVLIARPLFLIQLIKPHRHELLPGNTRPYTGSK